MTALRRFEPATCRRSFGVILLERSQERARIAYPAEQRLDHEQTRLVVAAREVAPDWLAGAVAQQQAAIVAIEGEPGAACSRVGADSHITRDTVMTDTPA